MLNGAEPLRPKVGLALGSGGLRGMAHVGVLKVLERENIPVDYIAGCSIGSLIGALYCSGLPLDTIHKLAKHLKQRYWLDFAIPTMGIFSGERVLDTIRLLTQQKKFDQLNIPLAVVATELRSGKEIVLTDGDVAAAVRGSVSVPGIFIPYQMGDMLLVDGAVINPTPIDVARNMGADIVIAVDLAHAGTVCVINNIFDVIIQSIDIMERELFKYREHFGDVVIRPDIAHISPSAFDSTDECVLLGEEAAERALPEIQRLLGLEVSEYKQENAKNPVRLSANEY